jgi:MFS family permease
VAGNPISGFISYVESQTHSMEKTITLENSVTNETKPLNIEWKQLWSLTALYASVVIGWIAYQNYQPKLLVKFSFTEFAFLLTVAQGIILVVTPPIAGRIGDRYRFERGSRIPVISAGISFAAMIFMAVAFTLLGNPGEIFKWVLPFLIIFWLIAMSIFTSPALSTIETFMPVDKLPRAMAVLTVVGNLIYSLEPVIVDIIDYLGAPITFISGGAVVFLSGYALKKNSISLFNSTDKKKTQASFKLDTQKSEYGYILLLGIVLGIATAVLFEIFPAVMSEKLAVLFTGNSKIVSVGILIISAILCVPFSTLVNTYGLKKSFWVSGVATMLAIAGVLLFQAPLAVLLMTAIFAIGFAALSVSSLPLAIGKANYYQKVFCVGIFFAGVELPDTIIEIIQAW